MLALNSIFFPKYYLFDQVRFDLELELELE